MAPENPPLAFQRFVFSPVPPWLYVKTVTRWCKCSHQCCYNRSEGTSSVVVFPQRWFILKCGDVQATCYGKVKYNGLLAWLLEKDTQSTQSTALSTIQPCVCNVKCSQIKFWLPGDTKWKYVTVWYFRSAHVTDFVSQWYQKSVTLTWDQLQHRINHFNMTAINYYKEFSIFDMFVYLCISKSLDFSALFKKVNI